MRRHATVDLVLLASGVIASGLLATGARADIWKWVDSHGQVQYSDRWTPGAVLIKGERGHESDAPGPSDDQAKLDASNRRISEQLDKEAAQRAVQKDESAARVEQCKQAKDHYQKVIVARRIYREGKNGERQYLTDDEADKERVQARLDMQSACGTSGS